MIPKLCPANPKHQTLNTKHQTPNAESQLKPKSKFLGNSAASIMEGTGTLHDLVHSTPPLHYRGASLIRNTHPPRIIGP